MDEIKSPRSSLDVLIKKLGHELEEIRVRSLKNILSKLDHSLVTIEDLASERVLYVKLLEWFNFPSPPMKMEVLTLISHLSRLSDGAKVLNDIGGFEFLKKLQDDIHVSLQSLIMEVTDNLSHTMSKVDIGNKCSYQPCTSEVNKLTASILQSPSSEERNFFPAILSIKENVQDANDDSIVSQMLEPSQEISFCNLSGLNVTDYMETAADTYDQLSERTLTIDSILLPWLTLTSSDQYVLSSINTSLQSRDLKLIISSCDFLTDVVFQDFPAEIFLQHPRYILKALYDLLGQRHQNLKLTSKVLECLHTLTSNLKKRLRLIFDPSMFQLKPESDLRSAPASIGASQFQQQDLPQSYEINGCASEKLPSDSETDSIETLSAMQALQLSLPEFCALLFNNGSILLEQNNYQVISFLISILHTVLDLLQLCLILFQVEDDGLLQNILNMFNPFFNVAGKLIINCQKKMKTFLHNDCTVSSIRLTSLCLIDISTKLLKMCISPSQIANIKLPETFLQAIEILIFDFAFMQCHVEVHEFFLQCAQYLKNQIFINYFEARSLCEQMEAVMQFIHQKDSDEFEELLSMAEKSVNCISFHRCMAFVDAYVHFYCRMCSNTSILETCIERGRTIFLHLIQNECETIRITLYQSLEKLLKKLFSSSQFTELNFITDSIILNVISLALSDAATQISLIAQNIFSLILQNKVNSGTQWEKMIKNLLPSFSILQGYADSTLFGQHLCELFEPEVTHLSVLEILKGNFRLLLSKDQKLRATACNNLVRVWSKYNGDIEQLDTHKKYSSELLICETMTDLTKAKIPFTYEVDPLITALNILNNTSMDWNIRCSSCQRIAYFLDDTSLHKVFLKHNGIEVLLNVTEDILIVSETPVLTKKDIIATLVSCFHSFLKIVTQNSNARSQLANNLKCYTLLWKGTLLLQEHLQPKHELAQIVALLVFNDCMKCTKLSEDGSMMSTESLLILSTIVERYMIPFSTTTYSSQDHLMLHLKRNTSAQVHTTTLDKLALQMVRTSWNATWHGGLNKLAETPPNTVQSCDMFFSTSMNLTSLDHSLVKITCTKTAFAYDLESIKNGCSHREVRNLLSVLHLRLILSAGSDLLDFATWHETFKRFLHVLPHSKADESLLYDILTFTMLVLSQQKFISNREIKEWIVSDILNSKNVVINLIVNRSSLSEKDLHKMSSKPLNLQLIKVVTKAMASAEYSTSIDSAKNIQGELLKNLTFEDTRQVYNLSILERTLQCFVHITAKCGWSNGLEKTKETFYEQMVIALVDIMFAFSAGRGGSYMGKGVTKAATLIMKHLFLELKIQNSLSVIDGLESNRAGLMWLIPLWSYSDLEVRTSSIGIAALLASTNDGCLMLNQYTKHLEGGVWGSCLFIIFNEAEASCVKEQAVYLLINLFNSQSTKNEPIWSELAFFDLQKQVSLYGLKALAEIFQQSNFHTEINKLLMCYMQVSCTPLTALWHLSPNYHSVNGTFQRMIVTPALVSAVAILVGILTELLPETILIQKLGDTFFKFLDGLQLMDLALVNQHNYNQVEKLVQMHISILNLIVSWSLKDECFKDYVSNNPVILKKLLPLLDCRLRAKLEKSHLIDELSLMILKLLNIMLNNLERTESFFIAQQIKFHWTTLAGNLEATLLNCSASEILLGITLRSLNLIAILSVNKTVDDASLVNIFESLHESTIDPPWGYKFAKVLFGLYKKYFFLPTSTSNPLKILTMKTFGALLAVSRTSKETAVKDGILKVIIDQLQNIHVHCTLNSFSSPSTLRKKEFHIFDDFQSLLILLNNLIFNWEEGKNLAFELGINDMLKLLWVWIIQDFNLTTLMLKLLCTFTSRDFNDAFLQKQQQTNPKCSLKSNMVYSVLQLTLCEIDHFSGKQDTAHGKLVFEILSNLCTFTDSRNFLCKSTLFEEFKKLDLRLVLASKSSQDLAILWFQFLSHVSLYQDGQESIFKLSGGIDMLIEFLESCTLSCNQLAYVTLHNLCFHSVYRSRLLHREKVLAFLLNKVNEGPSNLKLIAISALWALCNNCQKTKSFFRSENILKRLSECKEYCQTTEINPDENKGASEMLEVVINICSS